MARDLGHSDPRTFDEHFFNGLLDKTDVMGTFSAISTGVRGLLAVVHLFRQSSYKEKLEHSSEVHKNYICDMQGQLADYALVARTKHEALREALSLYNSQMQKKRTRRPSSNSILSRCDELEKFLEHGHVKACKATFVSLEKHFALRRKSSLHSPRFCIKLVKDERVFTFLRDQGHSGGALPITDAIQSNKGFESIKESGRYFFCNEIPVEAKANRYFNPRLRREGVAEYSPSWKWSIKRTCSLNQPIPDNAWVNCWSNGADPNGIPSAEQCYKSTLIVPMTLRYEQVSSEFWNEFVRHIDTENPFEKGSFGFLCMDCHEENYFDMDLDSKFGYVCADILSLFSVATYLYTSLSPAYRSARAILARV